MKTYLKEKVLDNDVMCQSKTCWHRWTAQLRQAGRNVFLCADCADYLLSLREQNDEQCSANSFVENCF